MRWPSFVEWLIIFTGGLCLFIFSASELIEKFDIKKDKDKDKDKDK